MSAETFAALCYAELSLRAFAIHGAAAGLYLILRLARTEHAGIVAAALWLLLQAVWLTWSRPGSAPLAPAGW